MAPPMILNDEAIAEVRHLLSIGWSTREIGHRMKCAHNTIRLIAEKNGIVIGSVSERRRAVVRRMILQEGKTPQEVALLIELKVPTIYKYVGSPEDKQIRRQRRKVKALEKHKAIQKPQSQIDTPVSNYISPFTQDIRELHSRMFYKPQKKRTRNQLSPQEIANQIEAFIVERGITKCPTMFVAPTQVRQPPR